MTPLISYSALILIPKSSLESSQKSVLSPIIYPHEGDVMGSTVPPIYHSTVCQQVCGGVRGPSRASLAARPLTHAIPHGHAPTAALVSPKCQSLVHVLAVFMSQQD